MCGIFGYIGKKEAQEILLDGLHLLEYRGYDSAGIAVLNGSLSILKTIGDVQCLIDKTRKNPFAGNMGIAHTRWATHGKVSEENAHPHQSFSGRFVLVHNGIVENYREIYSMLIINGYSFHGETDSEVLVNYIDYLVVVCKLSTEKALQRVLQDLKGAYAFVLIDEQEQERIYAVRQMSPLIVGKSGSEYFLSSDIHALSNYANQYFIMGNKSIAILSRGIEPKLLDREGVSQVIDYHELKKTLLDSGLSGYAHYMHKEINEQPEIISRILSSSKGNIFSDFDCLDGKLTHFKRIIILACGTSYHAGMIGRYLLEKYAKIPVSVEYAAEFRYRYPVLGPNDLVLGISQSGETADTLAAMRLAREKGAFVLTLCNVPESSMARESDASVFLEAGAEIGVASTKAFTAQVLKLIQLTAYMAVHEFQEFAISDLIEELNVIPFKMRSILTREPYLVELAKKYGHYKHFLFLGRGINHPVALEGALKLKEISYIHAEGYPASEMKHGPIALIDENFPIVALACDAENRGKMISNIMEVKARIGIVIALIQEGDKEIAGMVNEIIEIPSSHDALVPLLSVIPLQLFAYHTALHLGCNVDRPRNLAKSVTVE
jgi:glucosamine--fructose-6-phosphate aminotransferase (isomerizing)